MWQTQTPQTIHHKSDDSLLTLQQKSQILSDFIDWKINHPYLYKTGQLLPFIGSMLSKYDYLTEPTLMNELQYVMSNFGDVGTLLPFVNTLGRLPKMINPTKAQKIIAKTQLYGEKMAKDMVINPMKGVGYIDDGIDLVSPVSHEEEYKPMKWTIN